MAIAGVASSTLIMPRPTWAALNFLVEQPFFKAHPSDSIDRLAVQSLHSSDRGQRSESLE